MNADEQRAEFVRQLRDLANFVEAGRICDYLVRVDFGVRERPGTAWRQLENNGLQTVTVVVRGPTVIEAVRLEAEPKLDWKADGPQS